MEKKKWWKEWRQLAAYVYIGICVFDFVGMPIYYEIAHKPLSKSELVATVAPLSPENQVQSMNIIASEQRWKPLTLDEAGMFHIAFGAILGVAAFSRRKEYGHPIDPEV